MHPIYCSCMRQHADHPSVRERFEDILREVGTLLVAFAPLDVALTAEKTKSWSSMLLFLSLGLLFLTIALVAEQRRHHDA
jgi:cyanate permease